MMNSFESSIGKFASLFAYVTILICPTFSMGRVWYVDDDAAGANDGTSWTDAFHELQAALAVVAAGDEVWVAAGTYRPDFDVTTDRHTGDRNMSFQLKSGIALYGGFRGNETTRDQRDNVANESALSGSRLSRHVVTATMADSTAILDGFVILSGSATAPSFPDNSGGGMFVFEASPIVRNCRLIGNDADNDGGAVYNDGGSPIFSHCVFIGNRALRGAGVFNRGGEPTFQNCRFADNRFAVGLIRGVDGGAMFNLETHVIVHDCSFLNNAAPTLCPSGRCSGGFGGAINNLQSHVSLTHCFFDENRATRRGGAVMIQDGTAQLIACSFQRNVASGSGFPDALGGAIANSQAKVCVVNSVFYGNHSDSYGGGVGTTNVGDTALVNCTLTQNTARERGNGISHRNSLGSLFVTNTVLWNNGRDGANASDQVSSFGSTIIKHSCVQGGWHGVGNVDADPLFVRDPDEGGDGWADDPATPDVDEGANDDFGDLRLRAGSPCIDVGDNGAIPQDGGDQCGDGDTSEPIPYDLDGNPRIVNGIVDMGAYEFQGTPVLIQIMDGLGPAPNAFISPLGEDVHFTQFGLTTDIALESINVVSSTYTGGGIAPTVESFTRNNDGTHTVNLDRPVAPSHWLKLQLEVTGLIPAVTGVAGATAPAMFDIWLAQLPLDISQDGVVTIHDATAFGDEFRGAKSPLLADLNGDGVVNVRDATVFGDMWFGRPPATRPWRGSELAPRPE